MADGSLTAVVAETVEGVFDTIEEVRRHVLAAHAACRSRGTTLTLEAIDSLGPGLIALLQRRGQVAVGLGLIFAPESISPPQPRLEWWHHRGDPWHVARLRTDLRPDSPAFYDYAELDWFAVPRQSLRRHVVGPYVDAHGTDEYMLTLTVPLLVDDEFIGVAGADVTVAAFEKVVLGRLHDRVVDAAVLNADHRVVVSTTSRWLVGELVRDTSRLRLCEIRGLPWQLAEIAE